MVVLQVFVAQVEAVRKSLLVPVPKNPPPGPPKPPPVQLELRKCKTKELRKR